MGRPTVSARDAHALTQKRARLALAHDDDERAQEVVLEGVGRQLVALQKLHGQLAQGVDRVAAEHEALEGAEAAIPRGGGC